MIKKKTSEVDVKISDVKIFYKYVNIQIKYCNQQRDIKKIYRKTEEKVSFYMLFKLPSTIVVTRM